MFTSSLYLAKGIIGRTFYIIPRRPERIQVEITNRCNYRCGMCPRDSFHLPEKDMPFGLFVKIIDSLTQNSFYQYTVTLTGWGEPLLHPDLVDMIVYTKGKGHKVGITTNGLLLAHFVERFIEISLDKLTVSLDNVDEYSDKIAAREGHPSNKIVQQNIESFIRSRGVKGKPLLTMQITIHNKQQCLEAVRFAGEAGADRVYLVRLNAPLDSIGFKRPGLEEEREIYQEAEVIAGKYRLQVDNNYTIGNGFFRLLYKRLRFVMYRFDKYCPKPYDYLYITLDGKVTPCCDLPRYEIGNILKQSLGDIWHGENIRYFRKRQGEVCGNCDALRLRHLS